MLPPFVKIMQSFILMQNTKKRYWLVGGEIFGALLFKKKCLFGQYQTLPQFSRSGCSISFKNISSVSIKISMVVSKLEVEIISAGFEPS